MRALYERIKEARTELHLSQDYVAKFLGVNRTAIVEIESGKRKVCLLINWPMFFFESTIVVRR